MEPPGDGSANFNAFAHCWFFHGQFELSGGAPTCSDEDCVALFTAQSQSLVGTVGPSSRDMFRAVSFERA